MTTTKELIVVFNRLSLGVHHTHSVTPLIIPAWAEGSAIFVSSVVTFYRNPLQEWLHWPIVHAGPKAKIDVLRKGA